MTPQLVDFNLDGHKDMIAATFEGTVFLIEGSPEGWKQPVHIKDVNDSNVRIQLYYDTDKDEYASVDRTNSEYEVVGDGHCTSVTAVDWDRDSDLDLVLGSLEGAVYLCINEGTPAAPKFSGRNQQIFAGKKPLRVDGGLSNPLCVDWNKDGKFDLICGGYEGGVYYFENSGTLTQPSFKEAQILVDRTGTHEAKVEFVDQQESISSQFVQGREGRPLGPMEKWHIDTVDYDQDGDLDILVGGLSTMQVAKPELNEAQQQELSKLVKEDKIVSGKINALFSALDAETENQKAIEDMLASGEYEKLAAEEKRLKSQISTYKPEPIHFQYLWLYRNRDHSSGSSSTSGHRPEANFTPGKFGVHAAFDSATAMPGERVNLKLTLHIPEGFHIYGSGNNTFPTTLKFRDMDGLVIDKLPEIPVGEFNFDPVSKKNSTWLEGVVELECQVTVPDDFEAATIQGTVNYMMCDRKYCRPPAKTNFKASLTIAK